MPIDAALPMPEIRLILACLHLPKTDQSRELVRQLAEAAPDWTVVLELAVHHRVQPLLFRALTAAEAQLPLHVHAALKLAATRNAFAAMQYLKEASHTVARLEEHGVRARLLKGVPLSLLAYGDLALRDVGDLDLLIEPGTEETADRALTEHGWNRTEPAGPLTPRRRRALQRHAKDYTYEPGTAGSFELDLHWRLFRNMRLAANALGNLAATDEMEIGGLRFAVLPPENVFLHLCVHGSLEGWVRLKSLADIAALWTGFDRAVRERIVVQARSVSAISELTAALVLCRTATLLDPAAIPASLLLHESDSSVLRIMDYTLGLWSRFAFRASANSAGSWRLKQYEWGFRRDLPYRLELVRRVLFRPRLWRSFDLPDTLYPLYALLSPLEWAVFHLRQRRQPPVPALPGRAVRMRRWSAVFSRLRRRPWRDLLLLGEASLSLLLARGALRVLPMRVIARWMRPLLPAPRRSMHGGQDAPGAFDAEVARVRWAVITASRYAPVRFVCFPQALAGHGMLRRRQLGSEVVYGIRRAADGSLRAHTWLKVGEAVVLGGETASHFHRLDLNPPETAPTDVGGELSLEVGGEGIEHLRHAVKAPGAPE